MLPSSVGFLGILCLLLGLCGIYLVEPIFHGRLWAIITTSVVGGLLVVVLMAMATQPTSKAELSFKVCMFFFCR